MNAGGREFQAVVEDVCEQRRVAGRSVWQIALNVTSFRPGDRGVLVAVARSGARLELAVMGVEQDQHGRMWHLVEKPIATGTEITGEVAAHR